MKLSNNLNLHVSINTNTGKLMDDFLVVNVVVQGAQ